MFGPQPGGSSRPSSSRRPARFGAVLVSASLLASLLTGIPARPVLADPAGTALQFSSASSQYVTFGTASTLGASNFTLETWFKWTGSGTTSVPAPAVSSPSRWSRRAGARPRTRTST